jgi:hypothetical protein
VTLPREWGRHCSTEYCTLNIPPPKNPHFVEWGGGQGVFTVAVIAQARHCTSPIPRCTSTALHVPYPPQRTRPFVEWGEGGGQGVFTVSLPKHGTARSLSPPFSHLMSGKNQCCPSMALHVPYPPRRTRPSWNEGGRQGVFTVARRPRTAQQVAYPPPPKNPPYV